MLQWSDYTSSQSDYEWPNFIALMDAIEKEYGDKTALFFRTAKQSDFTKWSHRFFASECRRIARGLIKAGLTKGDRTVLWAENRPEWLAVWMGTVIAGGIIVPVDYLLSDKECKNIVDLTGAKAFFYSKRKAEFVASLDIHTSLKLCIDSNDEAYNTFGAAGTGKPGTDSIDLPGLDSINGDDPASIVFTSGTTGFAKGVTLSHRGIISNVSAAILALRPQDSDVFINVLPLHHTYPTTCSFIAPLVRGVGIIIVERLVGKVVIDDIRDARGGPLFSVQI
ncbi:hypothetical protein AGMMS50230_19140 [Spirochaetia bacterium]|nr:hypothetical protein AGMMS50230_19140 [Spirochaetia bacterium]